MVRTLATVAVFVLNRCSTSIDSNGADETQGTRPKKVGVAILFPF